MASGIGFVDYVCSQIHGAGNGTYKKMFGEYGIYVNGRRLSVVSVMASSF